MMIASLVAVIFNCQHFLLLPRFLQDLTNDPKDQRSLKGQEPDMVES